MGSITLEEGEEIIASWHGDYSSVGKKQGKGETKVLTALPRGFLVLTNRRAIFLKERGISSKSIHYLFSIPLENVNDMSTEGGDSGSVEIVEDDVTHKFYYDSKG
ncbi:MAG: hypothetical protein JTT11_07415 [Candidatus Brockarchaeota archaeon]|nr:hypothetical protein [Candidatus Brockarchaeota archaeon]